MSQIVQPALLFLGHAGFLLEFGGCRLLCDPWLSSSGAFLRRWHQFPPNDFLDRLSLYDADFLFLSHDHDDHFDEAFLASFPKQRVTVVLARFASDRFASRIAALGFPRIVQLEDWETYPVSRDFSLQVVKDESLYKIDSALLIKAGGRTIFNKNDCHFGTSWFPVLEGLELDLLFGQFSGAMWYPAVYGYPPDLEKQRAGSIRRQLLDSFVGFCNRVSAKHVAPSAGPPCFLESDAFHLNFVENGIFHDQHDVIEELRARISGPVELLLPGDLVRFGRGDNLEVSRSRSFSFADKRQILEAYQAEREPMIKSFLSGLPPAGPTLNQQFSDLVRSLFSSSELVRDKVNALVRFRLSGTPGSEVAVDLRPADKPGQGPSYEFELDERLAQLMVEGRLEWEQLFLSMRIRSRRQPDEYNWPLFALLRYGHDPKLIAQIERTMGRAQEEVIRVSSGGCEYEIQRYCPHMGEDLIRATIEEGKLVCPRHHWMFDLQDGGRCVRGGNLPLRVAQVHPGSLPHD